MESIIHTNNEFQLHTNGCNLPAVRFCVDKSSMIKRARVAKNPLSGEL